PGVEDAHRRAVEPASVAVADRPDQRRLQARARAAGDQLDRVTDAVAGTLGGALVERDLVDALGHLAVEDAQPLEAVPGGCVVERQPQPGRALAADDLAVGIDDEGADGGDVAVGTRRSL